MVCLALATTVSAQQEDALTAPANLHREPEGAPLVSLPAGATVETGEARGDWKQATVEGWVYTPSTAPTDRDGFDLIVTPDDGENLRSSPNGALLGHAREGTLLERVGSKGKWTKVRREGWVPRKVVAPPAAQAKAPAPAVQAKAAPTPPARVSPEPEPMEVARETALSSTPDGPQVATVQSGVPARVVGRAAGWVKVQVDGWVKEDAIRTSDAGAVQGVTAEEVRTSPDRFVGQTLQWRVQLIAVQTADELRAEMAPGQPYLLTRGPLPEPGFVYVTIPPGRVAEFSALPPLQELTLTVTIRAARTRYLTTPVAELVSVVSGMEGK
ncbi:MAG: SH3 domain-containing protein [Gemmatimonadales bacterium]